MFRGEGLAARSGWLLDVHFLRVLLGLLSERRSWPSAAGAGRAALLLAAEVGLRECAKRMGKGLPFFAGCPTAAQINAFVLAGCAETGEQNQQSAKPAQGSCHLYLSHQCARGGGHITQPGLGFVFLSLLLYNFKYPKK